MVSILLAGAAFVSNQNSAKHYQAGFTVDQPPVINNESKASVYRTGPNFYAEPPKEFTDLLKPTPVVVDVYLGGVMFATTSGIYEPGLFVFDEPEQVIKLIAKITEPQLVIPALQGKLKTHPELVCRTSTRDGCGMLSPEVASIIYDAEIFRLDLFIAPKFFAIEQSENTTYLPIPDAGISLISNFAGALSGAESEATNYTIQNRSTFAWRNTRLITEFSQSSYDGFDTQIVAAELDAGGHRYRGGLFFSSPLSFTGQTRIFGASVGTEFDTLSGGDEVFAKPLIVFLTRRSKVNTFRNGRLLASGLYDQGHQTIDTSGFPSGAYNISIEIIEDGAEPRREMRFFTKQLSLPPPGRLAWSISGGALATDSNSSMPDWSDELVVQATTAYRLNDHFAVDAGALMVNSDIVAETGASIFGSGKRARFAGLVGNEGNFGLNAELSWFDFDRFSANLYVRRTWGPGFGLVSGNKGSAITSVDNINFLVGDSQQYGGNIGMRIGNANFRLAGSYYQLGEQDQFYAFGPSVDYAFRVGTNTQLTFFAEGQRSSTGWDARIGIRVNFNKRNFSVFNQVGNAYRQVNSVKRNSLLGSVLANYSTDVASINSDLSVAAGYARDFDNERVRGEVTLDGQYGRLAGQVEHVSNQANSGTRYASNFNTSVAIGGNRVSFGGRNLGDSGIMVSVNGDNPNFEADVLINNAPRARIRMGQSIPIFLPAYDTYSVRLAPVGGASGRFEHGARDVTIFAGNMATLQWQVSNVQAVLGRLLDINNQPLENVVISGTRDYMFTNKNGYFQGEIATNEEFVVKQKGKEICRLRFSTSKGSPYLRRLGDIICKP